MRTKLKGRCNICREMLEVRKDGNVRMHHEASAWYLRMAPYCRGSNFPPHDENDAEPKKEASSEA